MLQNEYVIEDGVVKILVKSPTYGRVEVLIDLVDLARLNNYETPNGDQKCRILLSKNNGGGHLRPYFACGVGRQHPEFVEPIKLYRFIMGDPPEGFVVDHINRNTLDNRRSNLRIVSIRENLLNSEYREDFKALKPHYSHWYDDGCGRRKRPWRVRCNKSRIYFGSYFSEEEAIAAMMELPDIE